MLVLPEAVGLLFEDILLKNFRKLIFLPISLPDSSGIVSFVGYWKVVGELVILDTGSLTLIVPGTCRELTRNTLLFGCLRLLSSGSRL